ncbi:hypothetical protein [uncultured Bacteroides sp.]|nr:hypothetical protein [uncultured Bacteroides sp.]
MKNMNPNMLKQGYILVPKKLLQEQLMLSGKASNDFEAFLMVLAHVNYSDTECITQGHHLICHRGESVRTYKQWAHLLGWSESSTKRFFYRALREGNIESVENPAGITQIRVVDYELWTGHERTYQPGHSATDKSFRTFWEKYHEETRVEKVNIGRARREWKKLSEHERNIAIENINEYYEHLRDIRYCKQAAMYLSDKAFLNEYDC